MSDAPVTVTLDLPLSVYLQLSQLASAMDVSWEVTVERALSTLGIVRWSVLAFHGGFPSGRLPSAGFPDEAKEAE